VGRHNLLSQKFDVFATFHRFQHKVERTLDKKIKTVQTDWGGEYHKLHSFFPGYRHWS
jgi:hypothetical protein